MRVGGEERGFTSSKTFKVRITAPAASSANATVKTSDWKTQQNKKMAVSCNEHHEFHLLK